MTKAQSLASSPQNSVWVSASAGTGKTKVLTDRVLRLLLEGVDPGKILCLTFTNAAAAEMANRIQSVLSKWAVIEEAELGRIIDNLTGYIATKEQTNHARQLFLDVLDAPDGLKIMTIHSFCQTLMKRFPLESAIPPHFQIIDEYAASQLLHEVKNALPGFINNSADDNLKKAWDNIVWRIHEQGFSDLLSEIVNNRGKISTCFENPNIEKNICLKLGVEKIIDLEDFKQGFCENANDESLRDAASILLQGSKTDIERGQIMSDWLQASKQDKIEKLDEYVACFLTSEDEARKTLITKNNAKGREYIIAVLEKEQERVLLFKEKLKSLHIAILSRDLLLISKEVVALYEKQKSAKAFLDYEDLILKSGLLLQESAVAPWVLYKLDGGIDHLLIDEAQDTSPEQWKVIEALCEEFFAGEGRGEQNRTVFVVGDEKQSIYSFQGADPRVFQQMHKVFSDKINNAKKNWKSVELDLSFRSTEEVLKSVDLVLKNEQVRKSVSFKQGHISHKANRSGQVGRVEVWPLIEFEEEQTKPWQLPILMREVSDPKYILAENIADRIANWLSEGKILFAKNRKLEPGDVLILVRRRNEFVDYMVKALKQRNIPVSGVDRMKLADHIAVMDLICLGKFLLLPEDDLNLATLLKTPFIGLQEDDIFDLTVSRDSSMWQQLKNSKYQQAYKYLSELMDLADFMPPYELYSYVLDVKKGKMAFAKRLGEQVFDPIDEFMSLTIEFEKTNTASLQSFIQWIESGSSEVKRDPMQSKDFVKIMTVHGAKGLQAPVVILPDTTQDPVSTSASKKFIFWSDDDVMFYTGGASYENEYIKFLKKNIKDKELNEYFRLLYVAMTRAEDELYVTGYKGRKDIDRNSWYKIIQDSLKDNAKAEGDNLVIQINSGFKPVSVAIKDEKQPVVLPEFIFKKPENEPSPPIPLTPSLSAEDSLPAKVMSPLAIKAVNRGKIVHKLLEILPSVEKAKHEEIAKKMLKAKSDIFSIDEQLEIWQKVFSILEDNEFKDIFMQNSVAEVAITGMVGKHILSGRIDRLVEMEDKVLILDYKTNHAVPANFVDIDSKVLSQMAVYCKALQDVYPDKKIEVAIIWTEEPVLMKIPAEHLEKYI